MAHTHFLVRNSKQSRQCRRNHTDNNPCPVTCIELENQNNAAYGHQAEQYLFNRKTPSDNQRFQQRSKETDQREADYTDRDIRSLDAPIENHPVKSQKQACPGDLQYFTKRDPF